MNRILTASASAIAFRDLLKSCIALRDLRRGTALHALYFKSFVPQSTYLSNHFILLYSKSDQLYLARKAFDEIPQPNVFSYNALLNAYSRSPDPNLTTKLFHSIPFPDIVSYNTVLAFFAARGRAAEAVELFMRMRKLCCDVDGFSLSCIVSVATNNLHQLHCHVVVTGLSCYVSVNNSLITSYSRNGWLSEAALVFDELDELRDGVSWNCMIVAFGQHKEGSKALALYREMVAQHFDVDMYTLASLLTAFTSVYDLSGGKQFHAKLIKGAFENNSHVGSGLIDLYSKCGDIFDAEKAFDEVDEPDLVLWNTMISGYSSNEAFSEEGLRCFREMQQSGFWPDDCSFVCAISACSNLSSPSQGQQMHSLTLKTEFPSNQVSVNNALVALYSKCGNLKDALKVFKRMPEQNTVSFNSMIAGYAHHGLGNEALALFKDMVGMKHQPTDITFLSVLSACAHTGRVDDGWHHFSSMEKHGIEPAQEHYSCMIDLLGRAGKLEEAEVMIRTMPFDPGSVGWAALLGACRIHGNLGLGAKAAQKLVELEPSNASAYVMLANMLASSEKWDEVSEVRRMMRDRGVKKKPGCSWVEVGKRVHIFVAEDISHPRIKEIYAFWEEMSMKMKVAGYVPDVRWSLTRDHLKEGETRLRHHSEKLAVACALISTKEGESILVVKNLRICGDCHNAIKLISAIMKREITVRDTHRFHCFREGSCSCGDYW